MTVFTPASAAFIQTPGTKATRKLQISVQVQSSPFQVNRLSGSVQTGATGDYVGYDPIAGDVFLITAADYAANYAAVTPPAS